MSNIAWEDFHNCKKEQKFMLTAIVSYFSNVSKYAIFCRHQNSRICMFLIYTIQEKTIFLQIDFMNGSD